MAEKTASKLAATSVVAPKRTKKVLPSIPCALEYFWKYALLAWSYCREHRLLFAEERPYFTEEFIANEEAFIKNISAMPNNTTRRSLSKELLLALKASRQNMFNEGQRLGMAIDYAYREQPKEVAEVHRAAAGLFDLSAASPSNWGAMSSFITSGKNYLAANNDTLVAAGAINATFTDNFILLGTAFGATWNDVLQKRKTAKDGTKAVADGIERIKRELYPMLKLVSEHIFKYDPAKRKLFTTDDLVAQVRSTHPAGVKGRVDLADTKRPVSGVFVEVINVSGKNSLTDAKGRYKIQLPGGTYTLRFTYGGMLPYEQQLVLEPGVDRIENVLLEAMPMAMNRPTVTTESLSAALNEALKEAGAPQNGTPQPHNGAMGV
ncbi:MAG: hypothetical protein GC192_17415 [Bacteroidetes bacterium]|nr:hypothetical protein [Bacteroidota bacterium]